MDTRTTAPASSEGLWRCLRAAPLPQCYGGELIKREHVAHLIEGLVKSEVLGLVDRLPGNYDGTAGGGQVSMNGAIAVFLFSIPVYCANIDLMSILI